ncbi:hypothetical protein AA12717_0036 [Gluconacetobacter sacchari DSM 12717]|uniref:Secreted protein n=1 Tax=Gluconacetobacter sacchari DSM 12717 TaxID=1307940 RepID=A0ABQ0P4X8_9PROT|nr:hypothetical protein AA12717_0036 [Gluconacetobacter sacchari DSM 12717]
MVALCGMMARLWIAVVLLPVGNLSVNNAESAETRVSDHPSVVISSRLLTTIVFNECGSHVTPDAFEAPSHANEIVGRQTGARAQQTKSEL